MTNPFAGQAAPPGYRQMGGGYDQAIAQANQQAGLAVPQGAAPQFTGALPPQMQGAAPMESISPLAQLHQMQSQVPVVQQPAQQLGQQPGQMPLRFGDMPRNLQQFAANQQAQQMMQQLPGNGLPPQQQQQQSFQQPTGIDPQTRLSGPGIPAVLQGRTLAEAISIFNGMQQTHLQLMAQQQSSQPTSQQPATQQPTTQQPGAESRPQGWDWRDPATSTARVVAPLIDERFNRLEAAIAPVVQQGNLVAIQAAMQAAAAEIGPQFTQHGAAILQRLQGADPRGLTNPQVWKVAAESVIGAAALAAARNPQQPGMYPAQNVQQNGAQPLPNLNSFYTEQPYQGGPGAQGGIQLTPNQLWAAQQMGMSPADYAAWFSPNGGRR